MRNIVLFLFLMSFAFFGTLLASSGQMWKVWQAATGEISSTYVAPGLDVHVGEIVRQDGRAFARGTLTNTLSQPQRNILLSVGIYNAGGILVEVPSAQYKALGAAETWEWEVPVQSALAVRAEISRVDAFPR